jgi:predicted peptidase
VISTIAIVSALLIGQTQEFANAFKAGEFHYTGGNYHHEPFKYHLFVPRSTRPKERYPLLLWLHGLGEVSADSLPSLRWLDMIIDDPRQPDRYRFFILVIQCPPSQPTWFHTAGGTVPDWGNDMTTVAASLLHETMREYPIDPDRVYLSGVSSGATGCWEMALRYPELFAAVVPLSSGGGDVSRAARLKKIPIWAFHNLDDDMTSPDGDKAMVAAVNSAGGNAYLTFPPSPGWKHDSWTAALQKHNMMGWMLAQQRGGPCWTPPGFQPWKWRTVLAMPAAFLATAWLAWLREKRKRRALVETPSEAESDFILCLPEETNPILKEGGDG